MRLSSSRWLLVLVPCLIAVSLGALAQDKNGVEILATLKGHTDTVYAVAFSQDGKLVVSGSADNSLKLWDAASGKELRTFAGANGHTKMILSVGFSPDGQQVASGSVDNTLKVWDVPTSTPIRSIAGAAPFSAVALTIDGAKFAGAGTDGVIRLWSQVDGKELFKFEGHVGAVTSLSFSPKSDILASSGVDGTIRYWNATNGQTIATIGAHTAAVNSMFIHPALPTVFSAGQDGQVKFWQFPPVPQRSLPPHGAPVTAVYTSADGNMVFTASADKTVRQSQFVGKEVRLFTGPQATITSVSAGGAFVAAGSADSKVAFWNVNDGKPAGQLLVHAGPVSSVNFNAAGNQLMTTGSDGLVKFWAIPALPQRLMTHPDAVLANALSADGKKLFSGSADKILRSWDIAKLAIERQFTGHTGPVTAVAISPNGQILASGSADATIRFWEQTKGLEVGSLGGHSAPITALAINAGATQLLSASEDGSLKVWALPFVPTKAIPHPDQVTALVVSPDGSKLITGGNDKQARIWNLATAAKERDFAGPTLPITSLALSADNRFLAAGSADKTVHVWNPNDAKVLQKITLPSAVQSVALSSDGKILAAGLADNSIKLINPADGKEIKALPGHKAAVTSLAFSPKGDLLFSAGADKSVQTWTLPDGAPKTKFDHVAAIAALTLSKDGTKLAVVGDKTVKVWNLADGKEIITFTTPTEGKSLGFAPDGTRIVVGCMDKTARLFGLDGKPLEFFTNDGPTLGVAFADAKRVVTAGADKLARVWTSALVWQKFPGEAGGKTSPVTHAAVLPNGNFVSAGADKMVRLWAADGKELKAFPAQDGPIVALSLNGDGTRLATIGDKSARVWNITPGKEETAKPLASFTLTVPAASVALSPNGQRVAVGVTEPQATLVRVFDVALGKEVQVIPEHGNVIKTLTFLGDNRTLLSGSVDKSARLSDVNLAAALDAHPGEVVAAQYHNSGTQVLTAGADKTIKLWDLTKNVVLKTFGPVADPIKALTFSRDFTQVGAATGKLVKVWNLADNKEVASLTHPAEVLSLSFNSDKTRLATGGADKQVRLWDLATGKELQSFAQPDPVQVVHFHPGNTAIVAATGKETRVEVISIARAILADGPVHSIAPAASNTAVFAAGAVVAGKESAVKGYNVNTGALEKILYPAGKDNLRAVAASKNNILLAAAGDDQVIRIYTVQDGKEIGTIKAGAPVKTLAFSPNSLALAGLMADKSFVAWNMNFTVGQPIPADFLQPIQKYTPSDILNDLLFAPDNATMYTAGADKNLHVWKLASPNPTRNFAHPNLVDSVAFHQVGNLIASGCHDGKIRIFDLAKNVLVKEITAHATANANMIYSIAFSPDGKQVVSACYDGSLKLFDVPGGNTIREFKAYKVKEFEKGHQEQVYSVAFSPDGKLLASGSGGLERVIKIWNVADGSVVRDLANPSLKSAPMQPVQSHPGWVYRLRFSKEGKLVSAGDAPQNKGYLAVWNPNDGKMLYGETFTLGTFFDLAVSPQNLLVLGAGSRGAPRPELNSGYLLKIAELTK